MSGSRGWLPLWLRVSMGLALAVATASGIAAVPASTPLKAPIERPLGTPAGPPLAGAELDRATEELASRMRCPVCQGLSIADSPSVSALNMRNEVRELLAQGYSDEQVINYFEQAYGEFVRLLPKPQGFNLLVWALPLFALLVGAVLVARFSHRPASVDEPALEDYVDRVREDTTG